MPDGKLYHKSCIHIHDDHFNLERVDGGSMINGQLHEPCKFEPRMQVREQLDENDLTYYSDWSVYAQMVEKTKRFSEMTGVWQVPPNPKTTGPAGMSSDYIFNGLEDGGGVRG